MTDYINYKSFDNIPVNEDWCFKNVRSTEQWTHGHHRYPAKFLPNLVKKLIEEYTDENDTIADMFAGCGTTLVEAKVHGRKSIGVDINPVAELITRAKTIPINPEEISHKYNQIISKLDNFSETEYKQINFHERIDYWFIENQKYKIAFLYDTILTICDGSVRDFFLVTLSHILKTCSKWLQSSTKPQIDPNKVSTDAFISFQLHAKKMIKSNKSFFNQLTEKEFLNTDCVINLEDARNTSMKDCSVDTIITSPPYVTSYEYADIHQLTAYWYEYISDLRGFRKKFIGTFYSLNKETNCKSSLAQGIVDKLLEGHNRTAQEVANYFNDMYDVAVEMRRILKVDGHVCLVIGNTTFKDVKVKSAEVFSEILINLDFRIVDVIKRSIPYKLIPTIRNNKSGRFAKIESKNSKLVYPEEYIIIAKK